MRDTKFEYRIFGSGEINLVVEVGIGNSFYDWFPLVEQLEDDFTILFYHRLGYGNSEKPTTPRTTRNISYEFNELITELGITNYILIGHSFGGLCVQQHAMLYPEKIQGIILIDSTSYNLIELEELNVPNINNDCSIKKMVEICNVFSSKSKDELLDMNNSSIMKVKKYLSGEDTDRYIDFCTSSKLYEVVANEFESWVSDGEDIKQLNCFPQVPLIIICRDIEVAVSNWVDDRITRDEALLYEHHWRKLQKELSDLSTKSEFIIANNSDHLIYKDRSDIVIKAIKDIELKVKFD